MSRGLRWRAIELVVLFRLFKAVYRLMTRELNETEKEIHEAESVVQSESQPEDPTATYEELSKLQVCPENFA